MAVTNIWEALGVLVVSTIVGSGLVMLGLRTWLTEKIKNSIRADYDRELATLQAELKRKNDQELEKQKAELKRYSDVEIEQLKSRLSIAASQEQVRFAHLHEKRAEVVADVYAALQTFVQAVAEYTAISEPVGMPSKEIRLRNAVNAANDFVKLFWAKQIFVPHATAVKLNELRNQYRQAMIEFQFNVDFAQQSGQSTGSTKKWVEIVEKIKKLSETALVDLENDFRRLLGDDGQGQTLQ